MPQIFSENKKAYFDYEILEKFDAGLVLIGQEVKSIRAGRINIKGSYVIFNGRTPELLGANIPPYQPKNISADYNPSASRKLLLNKKEIDYLMGKSKEKGLALIPLKIYGKNGKIKLEFGIARGKKKYDKREAIKKREIKREIKGAIESE
jgi:SsrA-binding protein